MGLLYLTPTWPASDPWTDRSSPWNERMMAMLYDQLAVVACRQPPITRYGSRVPVVAIQEVPAPRWRRIARRLHLPVSSRPRSEQEVFAAIAGASDVDGVFVQFATTAIEFDGVLASLGKPVWVHCHGHDVTWDFRSFEFPHRPARGREYAAQVRALSRYAVLIANSQETARRLKEVGVPDGRVRLKYLGVDVPAEPPAQRTANGPVEILYVGRLVDCKGPDLTMRAFEIASARGLVGCLTIAGAGPMMPICEFLRARSPYRDRIRILGGVTPTDAARLRSSADIFTAHNCVGLLTRQVEAYGVSFVEAMASGLPVVTGASGGVCETVVDGVTGRLVEPGDTEAHASALLELARDAEMRAAMGRAGWQRARDEFSGERERLQLDAVLREPQVLPDALSGRG